MRDSMTETPSSEAAPVHGSPRQVLEVHVGEVGVPRPHVLVGQPEVVELTRGGVRGEQRDTLARLHSKVRCILRVLVATVPLWPSAERVAKVVRPPASAHRRRSVGKWRHQEFNSIIINGAYP